MYGFYRERDYANDFPYTDLACERRRADLTVGGIEYKREIAPGGTWERIKVTTPEGARSIGRPIGRYDTLETSRMDLLDMEAVEDAVEEIARELCYMCDKGGIMPERLLVVGLGNPRLTPDSVGYVCAKNIRATMHIKEFDEHFFEQLECSEIAVITPDVMATSGIDASVSVRGVCNIIKPTAVIAIDAIASRSAERLGTTVQISDTGIIPGSGLGNGHTALNRETLGVPVISVGVPTVIDSRMFWLDAQDGLDGVRYPEGAKRSMFVSPKEINEIVDVAAKIISGGINQAFGLCP